MTNSSQENPLIATIDDDLFLLPMIEKILKTKEYRVKCIPEPKNAISELKKQPVDLILLDIVMPEISGLQVCEAIKADPLLKNTPVLFLTSIKEPREIIRAFNLGAADYIPKPIIPDELLARVHSQLEIISSQKQLKEEEDRFKREIHESEEKFRSITEAAKDGIMLVDEGKTITYLNQAAQDMFGLNIQDKDDAQPWKWIMPRDFRIKFQKNWGSFQKTGELDIFGKLHEVTAKRKNGESFPAELSPSGVQIHGKWNVMATIRDLTAQKKNEEEKQNMQLQLIQSAKLASIETLASGVAHELNNPLEIVLGYAELIESDEDDPQDMVEDARKITEAAHRMKKIINHLRVFSRQSKAEDKKLLDLNQCLENSLVLLDKQLSLKKIALNLQLSEKRSPIMGDATQLESVFQNLISNSRDAFEEVADDRQKEIHISTKERQGQIEILYKDNGVGISKEHLDHIFEPFFTTKESGKGTGLGMSITHSIVEKHQGHISCESSEGKGVTFTLTFPLAKVSKEELWEFQKQEVVKEKEPLSIKNKPKVLIVEDEQPVGQVLTKYLTDEFTTTLITDPPYALEVVARETFDLVVTDMKMPEVSGLDILIKIKEHSPTTPIILCTGCEENNEKVQKAVALGGILLTKPFGKKKFVDFLKEQLLAGSN